MLSMIAATQYGCDLVNTMNPFSVYLIALKHLGSEAHELVVCLSDQLQSPHPKLVRGKALDVSS